MDKKFKLFLWISKNALWILRNQIIIMIMIIIIVIKAQL